MSTNTGTRHFFLNSTGTVWQTTTAIGAAGSDTGVPSNGTPIQ
jgi:hypothetical protein